MLAERDIHWFAGLMEGEGWFACKRSDAPTVELASTDEDIIERVARLFPFGIRDQKPLPSGKTNYRWRVSDQERAVGVMMMLLPLMGERRKARIMECLKIWQAKPIRGEYRAQCANGHDLSGDNLMLRQEGKYLKRRCRACGRERMRRLRAKI